MILEKSQRFENELNEIVDFIALDSPTRALDFYDELIDKISNITANPLIYRPRTNSDYNTREMIFKGYTILY